MVINSCSLQMVEITIFPAKKALILSKSGVSLLFKAFPLLTDSATRFFFATHEPSRRFCALAATFQKKNIESGIDW